jgi:hypothetical protein
VLYQYALTDGSTTTSVPTSATTLMYGGKYLYIGHCCRDDGANLFITSAYDYPNRDGTWSIVRVQKSPVQVADGGVVASDSDAQLTDDLALVQFVDDPQSAMMNYVQMPQRSKGVVVCGSELSGNLTVFDKAALSNTRPIPTGSNTSCCWGVMWDGRYIWAVFGTDTMPAPPPPGQIARVDLATGVVELCTLPPGFECPNEIVTDGTTFYGTCYFEGPGYTAPGKIWAATARGLFISAQGAFLSSLGVPIQNGPKPIVVTAIIGLGIGGSVEARTDASNPPTTPVGRAAAPAGVDGGTVTLTFCVLGYHFLEIALLAGAPALIQTFQWY